MAPELERRINLVRSALDSDPDGIVAGSLREGLSAVPARLQRLPTYASFLRVTHGPRCGGVDFFAIDELPRRQFEVDVVAGGRERWVCVGQLAYQPLVLGRDGEEIALADYQSDDGLGQRFGPLDSFLVELFGEGYVESLRLGRDEWYAALKSVGLV